MDYLDEERVSIKFGMPLGELIVEFYDQLSRARRDTRRLDYCSTACVPLIWSSLMCW